MGQDKNTKLTLFSTYSGSVTNNQNTTRRPSQKSFLHSDYLSAGEEIPCF